MGTSSYNELEWIRRIGMYQGSFIRPNENCPEVTTSFTGTKLVTSGSMLIKERHDSALDFCCAEAMWNMLTVKKSSVRIKVLPLCIIWYLTKCSLNTNKDNCDKCNKQYLAGKEHLHPHVKCQIWPGNVTGWLSCVLILIVVNMQHE